MMTHWKEIDFHLSSLEYIVKGLDDSVDFLKTQRTLNGWYDGLWLLEEAEPIIGLALLAFQNYINSTIFDLSGSTTNKTAYYQKYTNIPGFDKTAIELIIGLANYHKHRKDDKPHPGTLNILNHFHLDSDKNVDILQSPIIKGYSFINAEMNFFPVVEILSDWRKRLLSE
ncbi:hypothetical protein [Sediminibacterium ginsengisoli]|uniref:Uncharacterized protein n=1 Tax=Sediminibacterium ginsengisoli TaxID=413434 RepID=A0A1T4JPD3_9BACT|nr:hypothetical protein [Sediminibacterium ginsengisoli]SJZ32050.1 hypothetical protein SAMN04488132_10131 [Sediminibacterium ginsengisoli]